MKQLLGAVMFLFFSAVAVLAGQVEIEVKKTATCGCCAAWVKHLQHSGFKTKSENIPFDVLQRFKRNHGIKPKHASCHTGQVGGYTIEGHVPVREIKRLLEEKPDAIGLSVPGMPTGSPGMEYGTERDAYEVLLIKKDGSTEVYASYTRKP